MEILINVPSFLHPVVQLIMRYWSNCWSLVEFLQNYFTAAHEFSSNLWLKWPSSTSYTSNVVLPIVAVVLVFWPILLSMVMTVATAWAWIFWLVTSILLGLVQVGYATYQFFMIAMDLCGLSILKTYTMIRHQFLFLLDSKGSRRKSRRKQWRQRLEEANNYENFLKIRIEPKDVGVHVPGNGANSLKGNLNNVTGEDDENGETRFIDSALPKLGRCNSFTNRSIVEQQLSPSKLAMARNHSFSGELTSSRSYSEATASTIFHDPMVVQELGRKTADLLVTTTYRLEKTRMACSEDPNDAQASSTMQYLLAGVVKRNHLQIDELLIQNARSIAEAGQYGLSIQSRHMIRSYYQEVEKCLDYIADAPPQQRALDHPNRTDMNGGSFAVVDERPQIDLLDRITLIRKMKQNMGRTALMLSGGT
jgi:hypothetical protein